MSSVISYLARASFNAAIPSEVCLLRNMKLSVRVPGLYLLSTLCTVTSGIAATCTKSTSCLTTNKDSSNGKSGGFNIQCSKHGSVYTVGGQRNFSKATYPEKAWCEVVFKQNYFHRLDAGTCYSSLSGGDGLPPTDIDYNTLISMLESKDIQLIDVREPEEVKETGMMPGAFNVPLGEVAEAFQLDEDTFQQKYGGPKPKNSDSNVIFSCLGGIRSRRALHAAHDVGYLRARHYIGGWDEYEEKIKS